MLIEGPGFTRKEMKLPVSADFGRRFVVARDAVLKTAAEQGFTSFSVPFGCAYDLRGADAEVERAFAAAAKLAGVKKDGSNRELHHSFAFWANTEFVSVVHWFVDYPARKAA